MNFVCNGCEIKVCLSSLGLLNLTGKIKCMYNYTIIQVSTCQVPIVNFIQAGMDSEDTLTVFSVLK